MKKTKLLGSKLIENINYPRIPNVCIFNNPNDVYDAKFEEGDLLDANSIKQITKINIAKMIRIDFFLNIKTFI